MIIRFPKYLLLLAAALAAASASAQVQNASITVSAAGGGTISTAGTVNGSGCNGDMGCETSSAYVTYSGLSATAGGTETTTGSNPANGEIAGDVTFFFEVAGPANESVAMVFQVTGSTSATGGADTEALAYAFSPGGALYSCSGTGSGAGSCATGSGGVLPTSFSGGLSFNATTNTLYDVELQTLATTSLGSGSATAAATGVLGFASGANTSGLSIIASASAVPEPASVLLSSLGCLALVALKSRRWGGPRRNGARPAG